MSEQNAQFRAIPAKGKCQRTRNSRDLDFYELDVSQNSLASSCKIASRNKVSISRIRQMLDRAEGGETTMWLAVSRDLNFAGQLRFPLGRRPHAFFLFRSDRLDPSFAAQITGSPICYFLVQLAHRCTRENNKRVRAVSSTFYLRFASERAKKKTRKKRPMCDRRGDSPGRAGSLVDLLTILCFSGVCTYCRTLISQNNTCAIA